MSLRFSCDKKYISSEKVPQCLTAKRWKPMEGRYAVQFSVLSACGNEFQGISEYRKSFIVGLVLHKYGVILTQWKKSWISVEHNPHSKRLIRY